MQFPTDTKSVTERLSNFNPTSYARTRNHVDGNVSLLSPYITHGFISPAKIREFLVHKFQIPRSHKYIQELTWREYFSHYLRKKPQATVKSIKATIIDENYYSNSIPTDILEGTTGIPVIDHGVRTLYQDGYLHNHLRMWLAAYIIHYRKVRWQAGAHWMYSYLIDGDLASNHLSWQWVAGTLTGRPYLFNADNVQKYAPSLSCRHTQIDKPYPELLNLASSKRTIHFETNNRAELTPIPPLINHLENRKPDGIKLKGKLLSICHPWSLSQQKTPFDIGVFISDFHKMYPWCRARWDFVTDRMARVANSIAFLSLEDYQKITCEIPIKITPTPNPFYNQICQTSNTTLVMQSPLHNVPDVHYPSFSKYWKAIE